MLNEITNRPISRLLTGLSEFDRVLGSGLVEGTVVLLGGEPGIGKSALLDYAVDAAAEATVLRCRGTRMEASLAFAALHELLWPVRDRLETVPAPQAVALSCLSFEGNNNATRLRQHLFASGIVYAKVIAQVPQQILSVNDEMKVIIGGTNNSLQPTREPLLSCREFEVT